MGKQQRALPAAAAGVVSYRVTPAGKSSCADGHAQLGSRYLIDLLDLLAGSPRSMCDGELRQFMPPASLQAAIITLIDLGLIECEAPREHAAAPASRFCALVGVLPPDPCAAKTYC